jgi:hypothetical protein
MMVFFIGVYRRSSAAIKGFPGFRDADESLIPIQGRP